MQKKQSTKFLALAILVLVAVQLACGFSFDTGNSGGEDTGLEKTSQALQGTQDALNSNAQQPTKERPTQAPPTQAPPTQAPPTQVPPTQAPPTDVPPTAVPTQKTSFSSGDVIYFTDFDGSGDWEDGWIQFANTDMDYRIYKSNGFLRVEVPDQYSGVYAFNDDLYFERNGADVYVETYFENFATHNINNVSLICRATENGWYEFSMLSGGLWQIWRYDANNNDYRMINDGGIPDIDYDAPHYLSASCIGDSLTIYIDGDKPKNGTIKDGTFREGQVGLSVYAFEWENVIIEFDYFLVQAP